MRPPASGRRALTARSTFLALLLVAAIAGCGGDDEPRTKTTRPLPDLAVPTTGTPRTETEPAPPTQTTVDPATETLPDDGTGTTPATPPGDTPENDAPPPEDTPAERFEDYCNENPGACG